MTDAPYFPEPPAENEDGPCPLCHAQTGEACFPGPHGVGPKPPPATHYTMFKEMLTTASIPFTDEPSPNGENRFVRVEQIAFHFTSTGKLDSLYTFSESA